MAQSTLEALKTQQPSKRPVNMTRAGYAGTQRYASSWTGDNLSDWDHLQLSISMTLNMGLSGAPLTGPDVGGFRGRHRWRIIHSLATGRLSATLFSITYRFEYTPAGTLGFWAAIRGH